MIKHFFFFLSPNKLYHLIKFSIIIVLYYTVFPHGNDEKLASIACQRLKKKKKKIVFVNIEKTNYVVLFIFQHPV